MEATKRKNDISRCHKICAALADFALADEHRCLAIDNKNGHVLICFIDKPIRASITYIDSIKAWKFVFTEDDEYKYTDVLNAELESFNVNDTAYLFWMVIKMIYGLKEE